MNFVSEDIENYCISKSWSHDNLLEALAKKTRAEVAMSQMLIGPMEASLLQWLIHMRKVQRVLEIGTYTGYSALAMAMALPPNGQLLTLDINQETTELAKSFWNQSPHGKKISYKIGPALTSLESVEGFFDFIFIDADKPNYLAYVKRSLGLLSPQGIIVVDNCLWSGKVLNPPLDADTEGIQKVNDWISIQKNLQKVLIPVRDGMFLICRK